MSGGEVLQAEMPDFDAAKRDFLHMAELVRKASTAEGLRGMLLMDAAARGRSLDLLDICTRMECVGEALCACLSHGLDEDGVPA